MAPTKVTVGMTFPYHYADSNPMWRVVKSRGGNSWDCVISDEAADYAGTKKVFGGEEILRYAAMAEMWSNMADEHADWWKARKVGETVHYNNGFGSYVRGVIVIEDGEKKMRVTALVGKWSSHDLPRLDAAGNLFEGTYAQYVRDGVYTMQPNYSNMVEAVGMRERDLDNGFIDPRGQPAIDLTLPQPSAEQTEAARYMAIIETVQALLNVDASQQPTRPYSETLRAALIRAKLILDAANLF